MSEGIWSAVAQQPEGLAPGEIETLVHQACRLDEFRRQRVLMVIPDGTRTAPLGVLFRVLHRHLEAVTEALDIMVALGTHPPMSEEGICARLELSTEERRSAFSRVKFFNHNWNDTTALTRVGTIPAEEIERMTGGLFALEVAVDVNRQILDYDRVIMIGPVFPHEVVGFSGGNKYLFPGVAGPEVLNFFHWLGAVITTPRIIGNQWTPVRRVIDHAASMVKVPKLSFSLVVDPDKSLRGLFAGSPEAAWDGAVQLSRTRHITYRDRAFHTILSCAPAMYDELWVGGKCMYKLEPVLADGGELIIHAPHLREISVTHGRWIESVGYHCRDYFLKQWDKFKTVPWGVLAHCVHVHGLGSYEKGVETARARVTLATGIAPEVCRRINLGYRDPQTIRLEDYSHREEDGVLLVPRAGEMLYRLKHPPPWAVEPPPRQLAGG
jgi:nickel-dependent lactate racemase